MIIFDSARAKNWNGRGVKIDGTNLVVLKSANFEHKLLLSPGEYNIKIIGKKRSGNGVMDFRVEDGDSVNYINKRITFSTSSWSEYAFPFRVKKSGSASLILSRSGTTFGSVEIARLMIDKKSEKKEASQPKTVPKYKRKKGKVIYPDELKKVSKKKIAFVVPYGIYGGGEIYLQEIVNRIQNKSMNITMIYMKPNPVKFKIDGAVNHKDVKSSAHLMGMLKAENFNYVVYYNSASVYKILSNMKKDGELSAKLVEIYHSDFSWPDAVSKLPRRDYVEHIITIADSLAKNIDGIRGDARTVVPVGVDLERFNVRNKKNIKTMLGLPHDSIIVGTVARLSPEKNHEYILELAKTMPDAVFLIVGDGPRSKAINSQKTENVRMMGFKPEVEKFYNVFDVFVLPSKMEGTPISILEAMSSGTPVCASKVGAIPDILKDGYNGRFLTMNPKKDSKIIRRIVDNKDLIENAREYIELNHNIEDNSKLFYESILCMDNFYIEISKSEGLVKFPGEYI